MAEKQINARDNSGQKNKEPLSLAGNNLLPARSHARRTEEWAIKLRKTIPGGKRIFTGNANGAKERNVAVARRPMSRHSKRELELAIQRYTDLFDFAPIGYVTFDRVGRIEE